MIHNMPVNHFIFIIAMIGKLKKMILLLYWHQDGRKNEPVIVKRDIEKAIFAGARSCGKQDMFMRGLIQFLINKRSI